MIATIIFILFMALLTGIKTTGIRLIKQGKIHGIFVILITKSLFWFSIIEVFYIWSSKTVMTYLLPAILLVFAFYLFADRKLFILAFKENQKSEK